MVIAGIGLLSMMVLVSADVIAATVFGAPLQNVIEIVAFYLMIIIVFLPLGSTELRDAHIKTNILTQILPQKARLLTQALVGFAGIMMVGIMSYFSFNKAVQATNRGEMMMGTAMIDIWPSRWILLAGLAFFLICLVFTTVIQFLRPSEQENNVKSNK